jgi:hypothetical protein
MSIAPQPVSITSFGDALGLAMALADEYAFANAAALIDDDGGLVDLAIAEGIGTTIEPLIQWIITRSAGDAGEARDSAALGPVAVVMLSVRPYEVDLVREEDLRLYRLATWSAAAAGLHLLDWIETDGDLFRSYANVTCPAKAWDQDPPSIST